MDSNSVYAQFVDHSFRRLTLLIHQQDALKTSSTTHPSVSVNKPIEQSRSTSTTIQSRQQQPDDQLCNSTRTVFENEPTSRTRRTFTRPPKHSASVSLRCSSSQLSDRSETCFNQSLNSSSSPVTTKQQSTELSVHVPHEPNPYDMKFERDRQNDARHKYNIPPPFQRQWLRQPRYVPQERPSVGQTNQSQSQ